LGDRLLAVGDASAEQSTLDEVMALSREAKDPVRLVVQHLGPAQWHAVQVCSKVSTAKEQRVGWLKFN
jgi:hypothetical protein